MKIARVGILIDQRMMAKRHRYGLNAFESYLTEILAHAGITHRMHASLQEAIDAETDILVVALEDDDPSDLERIFQFAEQGGTVVSYGGLDKLADRLGCARLKARNEVYALVPEEHGNYPPLRALRADPWQPEEASDIQVVSFGKLTSLSKDDGRDDALLLCFWVGEGSIDRFSVNIPSMVVAFQQGAEPVLKDGFPAMDGSAEVNDGVLKADDGMQLDWELDRLRTETGQMYFAYPYADFWREICVGHLLRTVVSKGMTLPFVGYWPDGVQGVATISHDSDGNEDAHAASTLALLKEHDIQTTWCMLEPGYGAPVYREIKENGHELAFHYNALHLENRIWDQADFHRQLGWLKDAAECDVVLTNKNHYTRFEGWGELFQWCEEADIVVDQTRGPSKGGNVGFLFGTCHPFFPIAWSDEGNRLYRVLEIGFLTQDMGIGLPWADTSIIGTFLEQTKRAEGVAHFLFHQYHIHTNPRVVDAFGQVVREARQAGFEFWTSARIYEWEMLRRRIRFEGVDMEGHAALADGTACEGAIVWTPLPQGSAARDGEELRFGVRCVKQVL
ncbi:hypothetical protein B1748_34440 [Paenibacillus sp. MY03]|uniref:hypothetical protein n=1 Tax=Paenibacillus sp. MY03 TaxID=302980 RepID=UPI000B56DB69|nr:hypothetical protein [Paenibacillus sp. MY03]OUS68198.1 hypothetical protein B1748_34440 [Paenibacillus sp. MY03]